MPPHTMTSYGRLIRKPRFWSVSQSFETPSVPEEDGLLVNVEYDQELSLLVLVHYRPVGYFSAGWGKSKGPSIKDICAKSRKIDPLPLCPQNVRTGSTPLVRADPP